MPPKLNRRRALLVLGKIDEILAWEQVLCPDREIVLLQCPAVIVQFPLRESWKMLPPISFDTARQVASYIGMILCEHTSGKRQRLGKLTKQVTRCCAICGPKQACMRYGKTRSCNASIGASSSGKGWARQGSRPHANWVFGCGSCCATRLITNSSAAAEGCGRKGKPMPFFCEKNRFRKALFKNATVD